MKLFARFKKRKRVRDLEYAQAKLAGEPSPFRAGATEKARSAAGGTAETHFIPS